MVSRLSDIKLFPYHVFLLPVFFIWNKLNDHFGLIPFSYWGWFVLYYAGLATILFFIGKLFLRDTVKAGCWATGFLVIFFFWGAAHDFLKSINLPGFLTSYKFMLSLILIVIILLLVQLRRMKTTLKASNFLSLVFGLFILLELGITTFKYFNKEYLKNDLAHYEDPVSITPGRITQKPDIFFIVFDEYASTAALKRYLGYDNSRLDSMLVNGNFFVAKNSMSNYDITPVSIASTFNMQYFNVPMEGIRSTRADLLKYQHSMKSSLVPQFLASQGYKIVNAGLGDLKDASSPTEPYFNRFINGVLYGETLWGRIRKEIAWNFPAGIWDLSFNETRKEQDESIAINAQNFDLIMMELRTQSETPKFVYGHLMLPHTPYYLNRDGLKRELTKHDIDLFNDSLYTDQLIYTNTLIDSIIRATNIGFSRPRVVIIEGDHGNRRLNLPKELIVRDRQFMNLSSYYFSDKDYTLLYDSITPVNTFRFILNKYFNTSLPMIKDSTILLIE